MVNFRLDQYFRECADYIEGALSSGGKILVNCRQGVSRSATIAMAFLMIKHHVSAQDAVRMVRAQREISPNDGFLQQLCDLNDQLHQMGHFKVKQEVGQEVQETEVQSKPPEVKEPSEQEVPELPSHIS